VLGERDLVRRQLARVFGVVPSAFLPLRSMLRVVTSRTRSGVLGEDVAAGLRALGFEYGAKTKEWGLGSNEDWAQGSTNPPPQPTLIAPAPRTHAGVSRRAQARFRKEQVDQQEKTVRQITRVPAFVDDAPAWEEPPRLLMEIRRQLEFTDRPTTAEALLRRSSVQRVLSSNDEAQNMEEVAGVLDELVKYGWLEFVPGSQMGPDMRKVQRVVYVE
jgi:hypothetical protein